MVLTAYFVLSPATNSSCHRHPRIKGLYKARSGRLASANLTPATGARTTRLCRPLKRRSSCTLADRSRGSSRPAIAIARPTLSRPPHPVPNVRDDRETPLCGPGRFGYASDLGQAETEIFSQTGLDRAKIRLNRFNKFTISRNGGVLAPALPCLSGSIQMRGIEAQTPPHRFCEFGSHAVGMRAAGGHMIGCRLRALPRCRRSPSVARR